MLSTLGELLWRQPPSLDGPRDGEGELERGVTMGRFIFSGGLLPPLLLPICDEEPEFDGNLFQLPRSIDDELPMDGFPRPVCEFPVPLMDRVSPGRENLPQPCSPRDVEFEPLAPGGLSLPPAGKLRIDVCSPLLRELPKEPPFAGDPVLRPPPKRDQPESLLRLALCAPPNRPEFIDPSPADRAPVENPPCTRDSF